MRGVMSYATRAHGVVGEVQARVVLGQREVGELEVGGALPAGGVGPGSETVRISHQLGHPGGGDEPFQLGCPSLA